MQAMTTTPKDRKNFIGGSDAAAILGLSHWSSPIKVWAEKTGKIEPEDLSDNESVEMGIELEDTVCRLFTKRTGKKVQRVNEAFTHSNYSFIRAHIDRRVVGEDAIFEAKVAWFGKGWEGEDVPQEYIIQVMHYLAVTGCARAYIGTMGYFGSKRFIWKVVERDEAMIQTIIQREVDFWFKYVEPGIMPEMVTAQDAGPLFKLFPKGSEEIEITLDSEADNIVNTLLHYEKLVDEYSVIIESWKNKLRAMLKDHACGITEKYSVTWKNQERRALNTTLLKSELPEVYERYLSTTATRVLRYREIARGIK